MWDVGSGVAQGVVLAAAAIAAVTDFRTGKIPNWLTLPLIALAPVAWFLLGGAWGGGLSIVGIVLCGAAPVFLFYRGAMGGGDVKLFAAIGAVLGPAGGLEVEFMTFIVAAVFALGALAYRGTLFATLGNLCMVAAGPLLPERMRRKRSEELTATLRIGLAIFVGALLAIAASRGGLLT